MCSQEQRISVKELTNFGHDYIDKKIEVRAKFYKIDQTMISSIPWVKGNWESPEGLKSSFIPKEASKWIGFIIYDDNRDFMYQLCFGQKENLKEIISLLKEDEIIIIHGSVFNFMENNWAGLLVDKIDKENSNVIPNVMENSTIDEHKTNISISSLVIYIVISLIIGGIIGYINGKR